MQGHDRVRHADLLCGAGGQSIPILRLCHRVRHAIGVGERDAHLNAVSRRDVALRLDVLPGGVVALRPDEREHVTLTTILAHEGRRQPETPTGLDVGREAEDRRGQQVHLVVDDQAPVAGVEDLQVRVDPLALGRHDLIGRDGHGPDLLASPGVLADLVRCQRRATEQFVPPLAGGHGVRHQDQSRGLGERHRERAHDGLARAAGQHDDARASVPEALGRLRLVRARLPRLGVESDRMPFAIDVPGDILSGPAELHESLLQVAPLAGVDSDGDVVQADTEERRDLATAQHLLQNGGVQRLEHKAVHRVVVELEAPVPGHRLGHVDEQGVRNGIPRVAQERVDHLLGIVAGGAGVPEAQRGEPVGVDVLRGPLQLGEGGDRLATVAGLGVVHLQQEGLVALDDQRAVGHRVTLRTLARGCAAKVSPHPTTRGARDLPGPWRLKRERPWVT